VTAAWLASSLPTPSSPSSKSPSHTRRSVARVRMQSVVKRVECLFVAFSSRLATPPAYLPRPRKVELDYSYSCWYAADKPQTDLEIKTRFSSSNRQQVIPPRRTCFFHYRFSYSILVHFLFRFWHLGFCIVLCSSLSQWRIQDFVNGKAKSVPFSFALPSLPSYFHPFSRRRFQTDFQVDGYQGLPLTWFTWPTVSLVLLVFSFWLTVKVESWVGYYGSSICYLSLFVVCNACIVAKRHILQENLLHD